MPLIPSANGEVKDPPRKGWTLALASLGLFMVALDTLVVTTALPVIRVDLGASLTDLEWTVNIYNLAFDCLLLLGTVCTMKASPPSFSSPLLRIGSNDFPGSG